MLYKEVTILTTYKIGGFYEKANGKGVTIKDRFLTEAHVTGSIDSSGKLDDVGRYLMWMLKSKATIDTWFPISDVKKTIWFPFWKTRFDKKVKALTELHQPVGDKPAEPLPVQQKVEKKSELKKV